VAVKAVMCGILRYHEKEKKIIIGFRTLAKGTRREPGRGLTDKKGASLKNRVEIFQSKVQRD